MKASHRYLAIAALATMSCSAHAEIMIDVINGSEVTLEGLFQADGNYFNNDLVDLNGADTNDGKDQEFELRRSEVILKGKGVTFDWTVGYDAKANKFLDNNVRYKMGTSFIQAGQYKQFNSLEELTSTRHNDFISKAMTTNLFGIARRVGVSYGVENTSWGFAVGAFGRELTRNLAKGNGYGARAYWAPINETGQFLHLGISAADYDTDNDTLRLRVRPDADFATARLIDSGNLLNADRQQTVGLEGAYVNGPFKVQAEYMRSEIDRYSTPSAAQPGGKFTGDSWYLYGLWNITGETWTYKAGLPVTPYPNAPASGMWQVAARYDHTDLTDDPVFGGEEKNFTVGVNWYWRANFKFMFNYVKVSSDKFNRTLGRDVSDDPNIIEARAQFYW
jgi:phosphate-selective porin OprO and OprP